MRTVLLRTLYHPEWAVVHGFCLWRPTRAFHIVVGTEAKDPNSALDGYAARLEHLSMMLTTVPVSVRRRVSERMSCVEPVSAVAVQQWPINNAPVTGWV